MKPYYNRRIVWTIICFIFQGLLVSAQSGAGEGSKLTPEQRLEMLPNDTSRIKPLFIVANSYLYSDSLKTLYYIRKGLDLAKKYNRTKSVTNFLMLWAELYISQGRFDKAVIVLREADELAVRDHNDYMIAAYEQLRGTICNEQGDFPGAISHDIAYMRQGEKMKDIQMILVGLVNISVAYQSEQNHAKAAEYAQRVLQYPYDRRNVLSVTKALEMISSADIEDHKYEPARDSLLKALQLYTAEKNDNGKAIIYSRLVQTYPGDPYHQFEYALSAMKLWEQLGPENGYAILNLTLLGGIYVYLARIRAGAQEDSSVSTIYIRMNNQDTAASRTLQEAGRLGIAALKKKARSLYTLALQRATKASNREELIQVSDSLATLDALDGRFKEAFAYLQQRDRLYDSVFSQENKNALAGIEADYKIALSDEKLALNRLALSDQIKIKWLLISSLSLVLLVMLLIYLQSRSRKKNIERLGEVNSQLDEANEVKTRFVGILNHDLRAPVANLINILHLQKEETEFMDASVAAVHAERIKGQAETLLETMEDLLSWSKGQMKNFQPQFVVVDVNDLFADIRNQFSGTPNIGITYSAPPGMVLQTDEYFLKTIMRNLTGNAIKSLQGRPNGKIEWTAMVEKGEPVLLIVDNGPGITEEQLRPLYDDSLPSNLKGGLGLHLVRDFSKAIGCTITVSTTPGNGTQFRLRLKK